MTIKAVLLHSMMMSYNIANRERALFMIYLAVTAGIVLLALFLRWQNNGIVVTYINVTQKDVPRAFDGFKILQISDLHNKCFGEGQKKLASAIAETKPDIIAVTGDIIDKRREGSAAALRLAEKAVKIAPVYYVPGNHERSAGGYEKLAERLKACGVRVIANDAMQIEKRGAVITAVGVKDWQFFRSCSENSNKKDDYEKADKGFAGKLGELAGAHPGGYRLLLAHRPEKIDFYAKAGFNLVLTGHAHGGQWRLPLIGGLYAPHQGLFPKYTSGLHRKGRTNMVVSRGLGNSGFPLRLGNRPELVVVTLKRG